MQAIGGHFEHDDTTLALVKGGLVPDAQGARGHKTRGGTKGLITEVG